jgi:hypothetical protein
VSVAIKKNVKKMANVAKKRLARKKNNLARQSNPFDVVELVAKSPNVKAADDVISAFYPTYDIKQKFNFLKDNFKFQIVGGSDGMNDPSGYYSLVIQYILSEVRNFGIASVKK